MIEPRDIDVFVSDTGSEFEIRRRLGAGAEGVVDLAFDRARGRLVALKRLASHRDVDAVYLKREFRLAVGISHPNLIELYELGTAGQRPFFTMEYVQGRSAAESEGDFMGPENRERLLRCGLQLLQAVAALEAHGVVHRDVKPSNVLVDGSGRVVLLDFGLSLRRTSVGSGDGFDGSLRYAAPEQLAGQAASPTTDIYSAGVVLYELATGTLPFGTVGFRSSRDRVRMDPLRAAIGDAGATLLGELLAANPNARPTATEAVHRLAALLGGGSTDLSTPFVGRGPELRRLRSQLEEVRRGQRGRIVLVEAAGGLGKTALVQRFCAAAETGDAPVVVARGRAQRNDLVPFAGVDEIVDGLLETGRSRSQQQQVHTDCARLSRVFGGRGWIETPSSPLPGEEARAQALESMGQLLRSLTATQPLVVWLDDAHWLGRDALAFMQATVEVLPDAPVLLVVSARPVSSEEGQGHGGRWCSELDGRTDTTKMVLGPLAPADVEDAVAAVLGRGPGRAGPQLARGADTPIVLQQLLRLAATGHRHDVVSTDLGALVRHGLDALPRQARTQLEDVCLLGGPIREALAYRLAGEDASARRALDLLLRAQLLQRAPGPSPMIRVVHERISEAVLEGLCGTERAARHLQLANALLPYAAVQPELVALQFEAAGEDRAAAPHARVAAERAELGFAYHRAAELYGFVLRGGPSSDADEERLRLARARCRASAGYPISAAQELLAPRSSVSPRTRCVAAGLFLGAGERERGVGALQRAFAEVGVRWRSEFGSVFDIAWQRARLAMSGFGRRAPTGGESTATPEDLEVLELLWTAGFAMSVYDPIRAVALQARHARMAVRLQDSTAIARSLATELVLVAAGRDQTRADALQELVTEVRGQLPEGAARAHLSMDLGTAHLYQGRFTAAVREYSDAAAAYGDGKLSRWELSYTRSHQAYAYEYLGDYPALFRLLRRVRRALALTEDRLGRLYLEVGTGYLERLAADDPAGARARIDDCLRPFEGQEFVAKTWVSFKARVQLALYEGDAEAAVLAIEQARPEISHVLRTRTGMADFSRLSAIAYFAARDYARVDEVLRRWRRDEVGLGGGVRAFIAARLARARGDEAEASRLFEAAQRRLEADEMRGYGLAARGTADATARPDVASGLRGLQVSNPIAWVRMLGGALH